MRQNRSAALRIIVYALAMPVATGAVGLSLARQVHSQSTQRTLEAGLAAQVDQIFAGSDKADSPGCALAMMRDGHIVYDRGYGMANLNDNIPITPSTVFNVASMSKQFTATAIVLLAQQGKLSLDDDVRKYVPELPEVSPRIAVRHLLHHTSGMRCDLEELAGWRLREDLHSKDDMLELLSRQTGVNSRPGEKYYYCNNGYELLALIVERASGQSFRDFTRTHIFEPLGMNHSFFRDDPSEVIRHLAYGHYRAPDGSFRVSFPNWQGVGATNLHTTVEDLSLWDQNFYDPRVGGEALIQQLRERARLSNGETAGYGYSFGSFRKEYKGLSTTELMGGGGGYLAYLMRFPDVRFSAVALCNGGANPFELLPRVVDVVLAGELKETPSLPPVHLTAQQLASRVGFYWNREADTFLQIVLGDGALRLIGVSGDREMSPVDEDRFRVSSVPVEIRFESTPGGTPRLKLTWEGEAPSFYEPATQFVPSPEQLQQYVGTYVNEELDAIWRIALESGTLVLRRLKFKPVVLHAALRDVFTAGPSSLRFTRDSGGSITGFARMGRSNRNIRFTRIGLLR